MERIPIWAFIIILISLTFPTSNSIDEDAKTALVRFMDALSLPKAAKKPEFGWNMSSDPCLDRWHGVFCDKELGNVRKIVLESVGLNGTFDAASLCSVKSVRVLSLQYNNVGSEIPAEIRSCVSMTHLYLTGNRFSGKLPDSVSKLGKLKRLHIANNNLDGDLPNLSRIPNLMSFLAENNGLSGPIPSFDFSRLDYFNISNNNFSGRIPDVKGEFGEESFFGNPYLCGKPLPNDCPQAASIERHKKLSAIKVLFIYSGYAIIGILVLVLVMLKILSKNKPRAKTEETSTTNSSGIKNGKSEYSLTSMESGAVSTLTVLEGSKVGGLSFEGLLRAPAELLGRGKSGSLYKVGAENGAVLAVKRVKNWGISWEDFDSRMRRIGQVKHRNVLPLVAYYGSQQEKLLVYEFQQYGSLFKLLHESQSGHALDWRSRLTVASTIAEALSFMHEELQGDNIAHGNLKSTNIMFNDSLEPCVSEYGLMVVENPPRSSSLSPIEIEEALDQRSGGFEADIYAFGVIILELLTGKMVRNNGFDLVDWVDSVVGEKWMVDVLDKALISEGVSEERVVRLLQIGLKCMNSCPSERPTMTQVSTMISAIKDEDEKSASSYTP